jgi:23S rRNA-/tRNA-specific pseudouridylate synthase
VWGVVQAGRRIDAAIRPWTRPHRQKMSSRAKHCAEGGDAITRAHHLPGLTLCQVAIHTGRTHQNPRAL